VTSGRGRCRCGERSVAAHPRLAVPHGTPGVNSDRSPQLAQLGALHCRRLSLVGGPVRIVPGSVAWGCHGFGASLTGPRAWCSTCSAAAHERGARAASPRGHAHGDRTEATRTREVISPRVDGTSGRSRGRCCGSARPARLADVLLVGVYGGPAGSADRRVAGVGGDALGRAAGRASQGARVAAAWGDSDWPSAPNLVVAAPGEPRSSARDGGHAPTWSPPLSYGRSSGRVGRSRDGGIAAKVPFAGGHVWIIPARPGTGVPQLARLWPTAGTVGLGAMASVPPCRAHGARLRYPDGHDGSEARRGAAERATTCAAMHDRCFRRWSDRPAPAPAVDAELALPRVRAWLAGRPSRIRRALGESAAIRSSPEMAATLAELAGDNGGRGLRVDSPSA